MQALARQLRSAVKRLRATNFSRERALIIEEAIPLMERAAELLEQRKVASATAPIDPDLAKLISALAKGTVVPGREFYINRPKDFDQAAKALIAKFQFEEIVGH